MGVFVLGIVAAAALARVAGAFSETRPAFSWTDLLIQAKGVEPPHTFRVEVAKSEQEHAYGLMFKKVLPENEGMLFLFEKPSKASFWMKNTLLPLDMLFIGEDWCISQISAKTTPRSLTPHTAERPVRAVLELGGGVAAQRGIGVGDCVLRQGAW